MYYYNKKNERIGHLFQERFKSEPCNDMEYFTTLLRYIHQNPVKAGIVEDAADDGGADADSAGREGGWCLNIRQVMSHTGWSYRRVREA